MIYRIIICLIKEQMKETFIIVGSNYGIATFIDLKSKTVIETYINAINSLTKKIFVI